MSELKRTLKVFLCHVRTVRDTVCTFLALRDQGQIK